MAAWSWLAVLAVTQTEPTGDAAPAEAPAAEAEAAAAAPEPAPTPAEPDPARALPAPPAAAEISPEAAAAVAADESWGEVAPVLFDARVYGYIDARLEAETGVPERDGAGVVSGGPGYGFDLPQLNGMVQGTVLGRFRYFLNVAASKASSPIDDAALGVRNAWIEVPLAGDLLQVRGGKTYRRFGLYNEILDATPTFIGIEPPELFDNDHLMLTRTTNFMVHGSWQPFDAALVRWALTTGDDERVGDAIPVGADLRLELLSQLTVGTSFYWTGGDAEPGRAVGDGSPRGGVVNWMERDSYYVAGGFAQLQTGGLLLQVEGWIAPHSATRSTDATLSLVDAGLTPEQAARFYVGGDPRKGVNADADYVVATVYGRAGYAFLIDGMEFLPYAQVDWYQNPETVREKDFGGDGDEAGLADDGSFTKLTAGLVFRPVQPVAVKLDSSVHILPVNDTVAWYPEVRLSASYLWELPTFSVQ